MKDDGLTPMNIEEFKQFLDEVEKNIEEEEESGELRPHPLDFDSAVNEAKMLLDDFKEEKESTVMNVFEFEDGYQVDIISDHPEFEIYDHLYEGNDVEAQVYWDGNRKKVANMK